MTEREALRADIARLAVKRGAFTLASGRKSELYFNLKPVMMSASALQKTGKLLAEEARKHKAELAGGMELGALPLTAALLHAYTANPPQGFFVRREAKQYGAGKQLEGLPENASITDQRAVVLEDVTTTGGSALKAAEIIEQAGAKVAVILTVIDREEGAAEKIAEAGFKFAALFRAREFTKD